MLELFLLYLLGTVQPYVGAIEINKEDKTPNISFRQWMVILLWPYYSLRLLVDEVIGKIWPPSKDESNVK